MCDYESNGNVIKFNYYVDGNNGTITLHMDPFFESINITKFRKWMKVMKRGDFGETNAILLALDFQRYIPEKINELEKRFSVYRFHYSKYVTKRSELESIVKTGKYPVGTRVTKSELEASKNQLSYIKENIKDIEKKAKAKSKKRQTLLKCKAETDKFLEERKQQVCFLKGM